MRLFLALVPIFLLPVRAVQICSINSNESTPLIVQKCRGTEHLKVDPGDKCTLAGLSQNDFHDVFATAKKVTGWIGITGATATVMNFSQMVAGANLSFTNNPNVKMIGFPLVTQFGGGLSFENNPQLEMLKFPLLEKMDAVDGSFLVKNNPVLKFISFFKLKHWTGRDLVVEGNEILEKIQFTFAATATEKDFVVLNLRIEDNESLERVTITLVGNGPFHMNVTQNMEIVSNRRLLYPALAADDPVAVRVRGNPLLDLPNLERLKKQFNSSSSEIQDRGECLFKKPLGRLNLLNGCNYVYGNLVLDSPVVGMTGARLNRVEGDVFISNNPVDSLDFLRETTIFGKFESSRCDFDFTGFKDGKKGVKVGCTTGMTTGAGGGITSGTTAVATRSTGGATTVGMARTTEEMKGTGDSLGTAKADLFPYREVIIPSSILFIVLILLGVFWRARKARNEEKKKEQEKASSGSQKSSERVG